MSKKLKYSSKFWLIITFKKYNLKQEFDRIVIIMKLESKTRIKMKVLYSFYCVYISCVLHRPRFKLAKRSFKKCSHNYETKKNYFKLSNLLIRVYMNMQKQTFMSLWYVLYLWKLFKFESTPPIFLSYSTSSKNVSENI